MRRVPSCLLFAALALSIGLLLPQGAIAGPGLRHGGGWGGHSGSRHWGHRHGFRSYARHAGFRHHGFGFSRHGFGGYGRFGYSHSRFGHHGYPGYGRRFFSHVDYGHHHRYGYRHVGFSRFGYGHHGHGRLGYGHHGYGRHFYGRHGYGHHGYGRYGYGFFPRSSWLWPSFDPGPTVIVGEGDASPAPPPAVPSLAEMPASTGIRSAPVAAPAIYVLESGKQTTRSGGAKIVSMADADDGASGTDPRIIHLGPRGR
jgi:hypothetical protein